MNVWYSDPHGNSEISVLKPFLFLFYPDKLQNDIVILKQDQQTALTQLKEANDRSMIEMSEQYKAKLIVEYQKYSSLEEMYTSIKKSYDKKMGAVEKATKARAILISHFTCSREDILNLYNIPFYVLT